MNSLLVSLEAWHWLSAGIVLLLLEVLGAAGFLLGMGIAAIVVSLLMVILPDLSWQWQFTLFAALSVICTVAYWRYFRSFNQATDQPLLNNRAATLIGQRATVIEAINNGRGKVQIQDAFWAVECTQDLPEGAKVAVTGAKGMTLQVKAIT